MIKVYEFAGIAIEAEYRYSYTEKHLSGYESNREPDFSVQITQEDIDAERKNVQLTDHFTDGYLENIALFRAFSERAVDFNVLILHGSAIAYKGKAYIYSAPSGTGKSTHTRLCKEVFGDSVRYINDDKPLLKKVDDVWYVYGSPWNGKHKLSENICVPLGGICELNRGTENEIVRIGRDQAISLMYRQTFRLSTYERFEKAFDLMRSVTLIPFWRMKCNISKDAAVISLGTMGEEE